MNLTFHFNKSVNKRHEAEKRHENFNLDADSIKQPVRDAHGPRLSGCRAALEVDQQSGATNC